jgi:hypothetical protein
MYIKIRSAWKDAWKMVPCDNIISLMDTTHGTLHGKRFHAKNGVTPPLKLHKSEQYDQSALRGDRG